MAKRAVFERCRMLVLIAFLFSIAVAAIFAVGASSEAASTRSNPEHERMRPTTYPSDPNAQQAPYSPLTSGDACANEDDRVIVTNPFRGILFLTGSRYIVGCAEATTDGPLLIVENVRDIWFDVRPNGRAAEYASERNLRAGLLQMLSCCGDEGGTLLGPGQTVAYALRPHLTNGTFGTVRAHITANSVTMSAISLIVRALNIDGVGFHGSDHLVDLHRSVKRLLDADELFREMAEAADAVDAAAVAARYFQDAFVNEVKASLRSAAFEALELWLREYLLRSGAVADRLAAQAAASQLLIQLQLAPIALDFGELIGTIAGDALRSDGLYLGSISFDFADNSCDDVVLGIVGQQPLTHNGRWEVGDCGSLQRSGSHADFYHFRVEREQRVTIDLESSTDTYLYLYESGVSQLRSGDDDSGTGANARIVTTLPPGDYYIEATTYGSSQMGDYRLRVAAGSAAPSCAVTDISLPADRNGSLSASDCNDFFDSGTYYVDLYDFSLSSRTTVTIDYESSDYTAWVALNHASGHHITYDYDSGSGTNARIVQTLDPGAYQIVVSEASSGVATGDYRLRVAAGSAAPSCAVTDISLPADRNGSLSASDCNDPLDSGNYADLFRFSLNSRSEITIDLTSSDYDTYLRLLDANGNRIENDDDDGSGSNSRITRTLDPGAYQIVATDYGSRDTGDYRLRVAAGSAAPSCAVTDISLPADRNGSLSASDCNDPLDSGNYADLFRFSLNSRSEITIDLTSSDYDTYLRLLDANGNRIENDDDDGSGSNSRITRTLDPGAYQIVATDYGSRDTGDYRLRVAAGSAAPSCAVTDISLPADRNGSLSASDCNDFFDSGTYYVDLYDFSLSSRTTVTIDYESSDYTAWVALNHASGHHITYDYDSGSGTNARIVQTLDPGAYQIVVSEASSGVATGDYRLRVAAGSAAPSCAVTDISLPTDYSGALASGDCNDPLDSGNYADIFRFSLGSRTEITIDLTSSDYDTYLRLLDASGSRIENDDDGGSGRNSRITRTLDPGTYQIVATDYGSRDTGDYRLRVSAGSAAPSCATTDISLPADYSGALASGDCNDPLDSGNYADIFRFSLGSRTEITIDLTSSDYDTYLRLLDASGSRIENDDDGGSGRNSRITRTLDPGTYQIVATDYGSRDTGDYRLRVSAGSAAPSCATTDISLPADYSGTLASGDCNDPFDSGNYADVYRFSLSSRTAVTIDLTSSDYDAYLRLLDASGSRIENDDDGGSGGNSRITRTLDPGTYQIVATDYGSRDTGDYRLRVSTGSATRYSLSVDASPSAGGSVSLNPSGGTYNDGQQVRLSASPSSGYRFVRWQGDASGTSNPTTITMNHNRSVTAVFEVERSTLSCGTTELRSFRDYTGSLARGDCPNPYDSDRYADQYRFFLDQGAEHDVVIDLTSISFDTFLTLEDDSGNVIENNDDGGEGRNSRISRRLPQGFYVVIVTSYGAGATGDYRLHLTTGVAP